MNYSVLSLANCLVLYMAVCSLLSLMNCSVLSLVNCPVLYMTVCSVLSLIIYCVLSMANLFVASQVPFTLHGNPYFC